MLYGEEWWYQIGQALVRIGQGGFCRQWAYFASGAPGGTNNFEDLKVGGGVGGDIILQSLWII